jgi:predicted RNase H-like HicB family nuclease
MTAIYTVLIEKGPSSYGAYVPDLPGCVAVGKTPEEVERLIREAIEFHIEGMLADREVVPEPATECRQVAVDMKKIAESARTQVRPS